MSGIFAVGVVSLSVGALRREPWGGGTSMPGTPLRICRKGARYGQLFL
jgi:hypothetical protein